MGSNARQSYRLRSLCPDPVPLLGITFTFHFLSPWYHFKLFALQPLLSFHLLTFSLSCLSHPSTRLRFPWGQERAPLVEVCVVAVDVTCCVGKPGKLVLCRQESISVGQLFSEPPADGDELLCACYGPEVVVPSARQLRSCSAVLWAGTVIPRAR